MQCAICLVLRSSVRSGGGRRPCACPTHLVVAATTFYRNTNRKVDNPQAQGELPKMATSPPVATKRFFLEYFSTNPGSFPLDDCFFSRTDDYVPRPKSKKLPQQMKLILGYLSSLCLSLCSSRLLSLVSVYLFVPLRVIVFVIA